MQNYAFLRLGNLFRALCAVDHGSHATSPSCDTICFLLCLFLYEKIFGEFFFLLFLAYERSKMEC